MRDQGLAEAIRAAGGVGALARKIGIAQPSVSNWSRIPAERVIAVEEATGVHRTVLRSDLYRALPADQTDEIDVARGQQYALLAVLLARAPSAELLARIATVRGDASPLGVAYAALAEAAAAANVERIEREFFDLFIGIGRGELLPYGSYYLTGFLNERPLARVRADLERLGIERVTGHVEPEDHAAVLCDIMAGLADGRFKAASGADRDFFEKHLAPWIGRFFADLEDAQSGNFYRRVGMVGRLFVVVESQAFTLAA
ncbi:MAG TPA: molecular chaperone TorD family protein [Xanthobacteraceae bacterium]|nr:molecular chaperone TorD family protein [Xanthobacteraceae bacterium]